MQTPRKITHNDLMAQWLQEFRIAGRRDRINGTKELMEAELTKIQSTDPMISGIIMEVTAMLTTWGPVITQDQAASLIATMGILLARSKQVNP